MPMYFSCFLRRFFCKIGNANNHNRSQKWRFFIMCNRLASRGAVLTGSISQSSQRMGQVVCHVRVEYCKCSCVSCVARPTSARKFVVLNSSKFLVLNPEIRLQDFSRSCEAKQGSVAPSKPAVVFFRSVPRQ